MIPCKRHFLTIIFNFFVKEIKNYNFMTNIREKPGKNRHIKRVLDARI
jgi:hypothetical protein